jgi:uncharacterized protein involved in exopolysaccharide biosynthesis
VKARSRIQDVVLRIAARTGIVGPFALLLRDRMRLILMCGVVGGAVAAGSLLAGGREWAVESSVFAQQRRATGNLSALAAQFGVSTASTDGLQTPQFYADLLTSRELLTRLASVPIDTLAGHTASLISLLKVTAPDSLTSVDRTVQALQSRLETEVATKTGVVTLRVRMPTARSAVAVNQRLLWLVDEFNRDTRQSQSAAERRFLEGRYDRLHEELRSVEDSLQRFLESNRGGTRSSPQLQFEYDRLTRNLQNKQQVVTSIVQALEQARIDEVRDTPTITLIESPRLPVRPISRHVALKAVLGALVGAFIGICFALWRTPEVFDGFITADAA